MGDPDFQDGRWEKTCREDYWFFLTDGISKDLSVHDYIDIYIKWYEVSTFEDLTIRVKDFAKSFVDTIHEPFLLLDKDKKVIYVNRSFCDTFKVTVDETIGNVLYDIGKREWDIPELRTLFDDFLQKKKDFNGFEVDHNFPTIGHKIMMLNARIIEAEGRPEHIILLAIEDITDIRKKENELKEYEARYGRYFETAHDGLLLIDYNTGRIVNSNPAITSMLGYSVEDFKGKSLHDVGLIDEVEFQNVLLNLKDFGFVYFDYFLAKTKEGKTIDTEIYLVDRTKFIQCNVRYITERVRVKDFAKSFVDTIHEPFLL
ncbi:MAG: PAS domain-containing protein, partial [Candidatus Methanoperedens sp.]|nr:PAS domain-containing protein [Candidatus Methanoperedens sp.]